MRNNACTIFIHRGFANCQRGRLTKHLTALERIFEVAVMDVQWLKGTVFDTPLETDGNSDPLFRLNVAPSSYLCQVGARMK